MKNVYSTNKISQTLVDELITALSNVKGYGSVEVFVQDDTVTQITVRNIRKTVNGSSQKKNGKVS